MFKKTLIAAAVVATTATFGAAASTVSTSTATYGVEYAVGMEQVNGATVTVTPGRDYDSGDIITVTFTGAEIATKDASGNTITPTVSGNGQFADNVQFLEYGTNSIKVLVTNPVDLPDPTIAGDNFTVAGYDLDVSGAMDKGTVKVSAEGKIDTVEGVKTVDASAAFTYITFAQQLSSSVTGKFDGVIDVNSLRKKFVDASGNTSTTDVLTITDTNATVTNGVTTTGATYVVKGDFSFLDENGDGDLADADDGAISSDVGTLTLAEDMMSATVAYTGTVGSSVNITVNSGGEVVIADQAFTASTTISYADPKGGATDLTTSAFADSSAGAWTLNGAQAHVPFLPFGSAYSQSVTVSNTSNQSGGVDLVLYVGEDTVELEGVATVMAEGVTDISDAVKQAVAGAGLTDANIALDIIVNAPQDSIEVTAVYYAKADGDRTRTK